MSAPFFFGKSQRSLFGLLHGPEGAQAPHATLVCAPLLQDGIRSHRALWALAQAVGAHGIPALMFDWYGTGDSAGDDRELSLSSLQSDLDAAAHELVQRSGSTTLQWLALRSAAIPLLTYLSTREAPADVVLWDPQLDGRRLVDDWREQHRQQLYASGRYVNARHEPDADDLLGFSVAPTFLEQIAAIDPAGLLLPRRSRVRMAVWEMSDELDQFAQAQRIHGVSVEAVLLDEGERPEWTIPSRFGAQVFPRRAVAQLAQRMTAQVPW